MPITTREQLIADAHAAWQEFVTYVDGLSEEQWTGPSDADGWTVKDHVAHVSGWDRAEIALFRHGVPLQQALGVSDAAWRRDDFTAMNEATRQASRAATVRDVRAARDATWRDLVALMHELSDEQFAQSGTEAGLTVANHPIPEPVVQVLAAYWGQHYREHLAHIRSFVESDRP